MASETLPLSAVPTNPNAAKAMLARISAGEVSPHPSNADEIIERLNLAASGELPANEDAEVGLFAYYTPDIAEKLKVLSAGDFETVLSEVLSKHCEVPVSVNLRNFELSTEQRKGNNIMLNFSVLPHKLPRDSDQAF